MDVRRATERILEADHQAWLLAALALAVGSGPLAAAARGLLETDEMLDADGGLLAAPAGTPQHFAAMAASGLHAAAAAACGDLVGWDEAPDEAILAQGRASALNAHFFLEQELPQLPGLTARLNAPGARMLDVGTGVAALACAYAERLPHLEVLGIDVLARPLSLAREFVLPGSPARDRVTLRQQDVATLTETAIYDLAWLPLPFIAPDHLDRAMSRVAAALKPGGCAQLPHARYGDNPAGDALNRLKSLAYGGSALDTTAVLDLASRHGLQVWAVSTPPGARAIVIAIKP